MTNTERIAAYRKLQADAAIDAEIDKEKNPFGPVRRLP
jgi:hypothetical protein